MLRRDLKDHASPSQLSRALKQLIDDGKLVRVGSGIYAKARPSPLSGQPVPRQTLEVLAAETFDRPGIAWKPGEAQRLYNDGLTTQVPWRTTFDTGHRRIRRRLQVGQRMVNYENNAQSRWFGHRLSWRWGGGFVIMASISDNDYHRILEVDQLGYNRLPPAILGKDLLIVKILGLLQAFDWGGCVVFFCDGASLVEDVWCILAAAASLQDLKRSFLFGESA